MPFQWYIICLLLISRWLRYGANNIQSCVKTALIPYILFYFFLFYFPGLYFQHLSIILYSIYDILYTIGKLWFPSFQWDGCPSDITTYLRFLSLRRNVSYLGSPKLGRLYRYAKSLPSFISFISFLLLIGALCFWHFWDLTCFPYLYICLLCMFTTENIPKMSNVYVSI